MLDSKITKTELLQIAKETKDALIKEWSENKQFVDSNRFSSKGLVSELVGLTGLMLLIITFHDQYDVFSENELEKIRPIIEECLEYTEDIIEKNGYCMTPQVSIPLTKNLFNNEPAKYTDTITWALSCSVLIRYAQKNSILKFSEKIEGILFGRIKSSLILLLDSQNDNGSWGFSAEKESKASLYFTYSAGSSLADYFDYIEGEIGEVEEGENYDQNEYQDTALKEYLEESINNSFSIRVTECRKKLADWLLTECLPVLPSLASCKQIDDETMIKLGIWKQEMPRSIKDGKNYFNLYYCYYIIDLLISSKADENFENIITNKSFEYEKLISAYKKVLSVQDYEFYFNNTDSEYNLNKPIYNMCYGYMEQAVHLSRSDFLSASRTGRDFWRGTKSELKIICEYDDPNKSSDCLDQINSKELTEPALMPLALRANAQYVYYVSKCNDATLETLFETIKDDRISSPGTGEKLWDTIFYNLLITERSVEAIVDYYDYFKQYGYETFVKKPIVVEDNSQNIECLNNALENMFFEFIQSDSVIEIIKSKISKKEDKSQTNNLQLVESSSLKVDEIQTYLKVISDKLNVDAIEKDSKKEVDIALNFLIDFFEKLEGHSWKRRLAQNAPFKGKKKDIAERYISFNKEYTALINAIGNDSELNLSKMYENLKELKK